MWLQALETAQVEQRIAVHEVRAMRPEAWRAGEQLHVLGTGGDGEASQFLERGLEVLLRKNAAVDLDRAAVGHNIDVFTAANCPDAERGLLSARRAAPRDGGQQLLA